MFSSCTEGFNTGFTDVHLVEYSEKDVSGLSYNYARAINLFEEIWICQQSFSLKARSEPAGITLVQRWGTLCPRAAGELLQEPTSAISEWAEFIAYRETSFARLFANRMDVLN